MSTRSLGLYVWKWESAVGHSLQSTDVAWAAAGGFSVFRVVVIFLCYSEDSGTTGVDLTIILDD